MMVSDTQTRVIRTSIVGLLASGVIFSSALSACSSGNDDQGGDSVMSGADSGAVGAARDGGSTVSSDGGSASSADGAAVDATGDAAVDAGPKGPPPSTLAVNYLRPDEGTPLTQAELDAATDQLITLLKDTRYYDTVSERVHGWPESDPNHGYWYGTWWSGVVIHKEAGKVSYIHVPAGSDNNGLRSPQYMEGACYAHLMWGQPQTAKLVRRLARGYSSWALSMVRFTGDPNPTLLGRAAYPASIDSNDDGLSFHIDYSQNQPGVDNPATEYVHNPTNPTFGDLWIKNKRSKDDVGHMLRGMVQADACTARLDPDGQADMAQMQSLYAAWSRRVEDDGFSIATLDKNLALTIPPVTETLAHYTPLAISDVECPGQLALRLLGRGDPGTIACSSGFGLTEKLAVSQLRNNVRQILRSHHEAAANWALYRKQNGVALDLLKGLADRITSDLGYVTSSSPPDNIDPNDIASEVIHAGNVGVPLTSKEVRWLLGRLNTTFTSLRDPSFANLFHVFDPATADGDYSYELPTTGLYFSDLGLIVGSCASPYRNPNGRPIVNCDRLLQAMQAAPAP